MITIKEAFWLPALVLVLAVAGECVQRAPAASAPKVLETKQGQISFSLSAAQDTVMAESQVDVKIVAPDVILQLYTLRSQMCTRLPWKQRRLWRLKRLLCAILIKSTEPSRLRACPPGNKPSRSISKTKAMRPAVFKDRQGPRSQSMATA